MISLEFENDSDVTGHNRFKSEWLETNGLGGWSSSSIDGCNDRRYHGILIAATKPPTERMIMVSKMDETIVTDGQRFELGVNNYGEVIHPKGFQLLKSFIKDLCPQWIYSVKNIELRKSIIMVHGKNTTIIKYEILRAPGPFQIEWLPLLAGRFYHELHFANERINHDGKFENGRFRTKLFDHTPELLIDLSGSNFHPGPDWYFHFNYDTERDRGLDYAEDLYTPGSFSLDASEGQVLYVVLSTESINEDAALLFETEIDRRRNLVANENNPDTRQLVLAADQFIVQRNGDLKTIIAGYHWFTDWGRDTMIALPGLCLSTGRFDDAKKILHAFAQSVNQGMLPNRFQDNGEAPEYNNVDGTLFYFLAIYSYLKATKDIDFVLKELLPAVKDIIDWHYRGTRFNIHVDEDGLLYSGEKGYQLTWMDARIGDWVVTPRSGKPVEIQALWYNAICIFSELLQLNGQNEDAAKMLEEAKRVKQSFNEKFWYKEGGYLYDVIDENGIPDASLRPNQLFAISLPFELIEQKPARDVMKVIDGKLYTPWGLRSLSPDHENYVSHYGGDQWHRDAAYHQGTVWSWLLGPYIDAIFKTNGSSTALSKANEVIQVFLSHLRQAGIGTVSEIFDAEQPFQPNGCIAQAWSVGEVLRVIKKYRLQPVLVKQRRDLALTH